MNLLAPRTKWIDEWFPESNPGVMIRPLHGDDMLSQIRIDVSETDEAFEVKAEIPGVHKDDIDIQLKDSVVSISATVKQEDRQEENGRVLRAERYTGRVSRRFELPSAINEAECQAHYKDGILTLLMPKAEAKTEQTKIEIN